MQENKRTLAVKASEETVKRLEELVALLSEQLGFKVSRSAAVELAVKEEWERRKNG